MKRFLYSYKVGRRNANGNAKRTLHLWRAKNGVHPEWLGSITYYHSSHNQEAVKLACKLKQLPASAAHATAIRLENDGIASFYDITV